MEIKWGKMNPAKFLKQTVAQQIDVDLMNPSVGGFSIDQLMELAGLSVAESITKVYDAAAFPKVLIVAGPGNNGGDGLVAARHLKHFGYQPSIYYPKPSTKPLFLNLMTQCRNLEIPILNSSLSLHLMQHQLVLDAIFGFSFTGDIRSPFDAIIQTLKQSRLPIVSIDIPSGWNVEKGNMDGQGLEPEMLISLTYPKECARTFKGPHFLGGRFIPPAMAIKYGLEITSYPGSDQCVRL